MITDAVAALGRVAALLAGTADATGTIRAVAEEGARVFRADRAAVYLLQGEGLEVAAAFGLSAAYLDTVRARFRDMLSAGSVLRGEDWFAPDVRALRGSPIREAVLAEGYVAVAALPLRYGGGTIGWLAFYHDARRDYDEAERTLARAFADQAALAIGRHRLADAMTRLKREWQAALDGAGTGIAVVDGEGRVERANRAFAVLTKQEVTAVAGQPMETLVPGWPAARAGAPRGGGDSSQGFGALLEVGDDRLVALTVTPRPAGGWVVALDDLTRLIGLETRYSRVVEAVHDAILLAGQDGAVRFANPAAEALFGEPAGRLIGQPLDRLLPREAAGRAQVVAPERYEAVVRRPDGVRIVEVFLTLLARSGGGDPGGTVAVARDVTEERLATEALHRSERRFRALFTRAPLALVTVDRESRFLSTNRAALKLAGLPDVQPGVALRDFVAEEAWGAVALEIERTFRGERREFLFALRRADGAIRQVSAVTVGVEEEGGRAAVLAIAQDVTDEILLRERLTHAEKMAALGGLVSGVAHELNNPLAGIVAMAQALGLGAGMSVEVREGVETIRREGLRAARIVSGLLMFARMRPLQRRETDLNALVRDTFAATPFLSQHGEVWTLGLDPTLPLVTADPDQIRQVVTNLLVNAAQAMAQGGRPEAVVRTWWNRDCVGFEVLDGGPGIPPGALPRIFEPFFTTRVEGQGTGLGLSISHGILRAHGGEIRGENRPGGGARFAFELPREPTSMPRAGDG